MSLVINNFLDLSKFESGKMSVCLEQADLRPVVKTIVRSFQTRAKDKGVHVSLSSDENLPNVMFDEEKVERMLINLLDNALKFTDKDGKISILLKKTEPVEPFNSRALEGDEACISANLPAAEPRRSNVAALNGGGGGPARALFAPRGASHGARND